MQSYSNASCSYQTLQCCRVLALAVEFDLCCRVKPMYLLCWLGWCGGRCKRMNLIISKCLTWFVKAGPLWIVYFYFYGLRFKKERHRIKTHQCECKLSLRGHFIWFVLGRTEPAGFIDSLKIYSSIFIVLISRWIIFPSGNQIRLWIL